MMKGEYLTMILEAMFKGDIHPADTVVPASQEYRAAEKEISKIMNYFEESLDKTEYAKLEKMRDYLADVQYFTNEAQFQYGFALGILLMKEVYELQNFSGMR